jgi:hypothetical protein
MNPKNELHSQNPISPNERELLSANNKTFFLQKEAKTHRGLYQDSPQREHTP